MRKRPRPVHDDLFAMFPDLPRPSLRPPEGGVAHVRQQAAAWRLRAEANIRRQRAAAADIRARLATLARRPR